MKYRELLKKYIDGQLETEERERVEAELEKHEAISDFLYEEGGTDDIVVQAEEPQESDENLEFVKIINRSIRRAFIKLGAVVTAVVLAVVVFCMYGLSPLTASFYYKPDTKVGEYSNQISLDWSVYSELTMPGLKRDSVNVIDKGYGKYNIVISQTFSRTGKFTNVPGEINRGKLVLYDVNTLKQPTGNAFACASIDGEGTLTELYEKQPDNIYTWAAGKKADAAEALEGLNDGENYIGYVSFEQDLNFDELMSFLKEVEYEYPEWCGVRTTEENYSSENWGYAMELSGCALLGWDDKNYPNLVSMTDNDAEELDEKLIDEEWCETHFLSMLKYLDDQKKFTKLVDADWFNYEAAIDYVEKNGLNYYGIVVVAPKEILLKINAHEQVFGIYTQPIA